MPQLVMTMAGMPRQQSMPIQLVPRPLSLITNNKTGSRFSVLLTDVEGDSDFLLEAEHLNDTYYDTLIHWIKTLATTEPEREKGLLNEPVTF